MLYCVSERRKRAEDRSLSGAITLLILRIELIPFADIFSIPNTCKICKKN